ncbi:MAG: hypothetical protein L6R19_00305 [Alphaproteobacteria bacterium]|nr:hypothetical protein [Alphaproteobacteria bacterium]
MPGRRAAFVFRSFAAIVVLALAIPPAAPGWAGPPASEPSVASQPAPGSFVVAQGRCFNGRCY